MDAETLLEIAEIRALKARYCRLLDSEQWEEWAEIFTDDVEIDISDEFKHVREVTIVRGRDQFVSQTRAVIGGSISMHQVTEPEIQLTSPTTAKAVWPMFDRTEFPEGVASPGPFRLVTGSGYYHETYVKLDGRWRIKSSRLVRKQKTYT